LGSSQQQQAPSGVGVEVVEDGLEVESQEGILVAAAPQQLLDDGHNGVHLKELLVCPAGKVCILYIYV